MTDSLAPVAVIGPTATGKSDLAVQLAQRLGGEIVNIDAMQQYRGMNIGTAKLSVAERSDIVHHQIDVLDVTELATVGRYQTAASVDVESIMARGSVPIIVGGSMMYIQALLDEWSLPATDPEIRRRWEARLEMDGVDALHAELRRRDSDAADHILPSDGRRIVRALEVIELTGQPFAASAPTIGEPRWGTTIIGVDRDTTALDERIERRTELMFANGFVAEVEALVTAGIRDGVTARQAIGYTQVLDYLDGKHDLDHAAERTFIGTRRYVRRQRSWLRRDPRIVWLDGAAERAVEAALQIRAGQGVGPRSRH